MPENNNIMSLEGQLVGMPLAGPESFSQQQLDYLKRALGVDETILWESSTYIAPGDTQQTYALSESPLNFTTIKVYMFRPMSTTAAGWLGYTEFDPRIPNNRSSNMLTVPVAFTGAADNNFYIGSYTMSGICTTTWTDMKSTQGYFNATQSQGYFCHIYKIIGVNRISS